MPRWHLGCRDDVRNTATTQEAAPLTNQHQSYLFQRSSQSRFTALSQSGYNLGSILGFALYGPSRSPVASPQACLTSDALSSPVGFYPIADENRSASRHTSAYAANSFSRMFGCERRTKTAANE